jgi:hypothetical protein
LSVFVLPLCLSLLYISFITFSHYFFTCLFIYVCYYSFNSFVLRFQLSVCYILPNERCTSTVFEVINSDSY